MPKRMKKILALLVPALMLSCNKEKDSAGYSVSDLSGAYTLEYLGPDSRATESNLSAYCGGSYTLKTAEKGKEYPEYEVFSGNSAPLFKTRFVQKIVIENRQGNDTVACYSFTDIAQYDARIHTQADSLLIADPKTRNRSLFGHKDYLLIQTDRNRIDSTVLYFKLVR